MAKRSVVVNRLRIESFAVRASLAEFLSAFVFVVRISPPKLTLHDFITEGDYIALERLWFAEWGDELRSSGPTMLNFMRNFVQIVI